MSETDENAQPQVSGGGRLLLVGLIVLLGLPAAALGAYLSLSQVPAGERLAPLAETEVRWTPPPGPGRADSNVTAGDIRAPVFAPPRGRRSDSNATAGEVAVPMAETPFAWVPAEQRPTEDTEEVIRYVPETRMQEVRDPVTGKVSTRAVTVMRPVRETRRGGRSAGEHVDPPSSPAVPTAPYRQPTDSAGRPGSPSTFYFRQGLQDPETGGVSPAPMTFLPAGPMPALPLGPATVPPTEADRRAAELAGKLRGAKDESERERLREELTEALGEAFDERRERQGEAIDRLEEQLAALRKLDAERGERREEIVQRRLRELLGEPDALAWDPAPPTSEPFASASPVAAPSPHVASLADRRRTEGVRVSGTVTLDGKPVDKAAMFFMSAGRHHGVQARTTTDGRFGVALLPGAYTVGIQGNGIPERYWESPSLTVDVPAKGSSEFSFELSSSERGRPPSRPTAESPADGRRSERVAVSGTVTFRGEPVEGANMRFALAERAAVFFDAKTDQAGQFKAAINPGTYRVAVAKQGLPPQYASTETSDLTVSVAAKGPNEFSFELSDAGRGPAPDERYGMGGPDSRSGDRSAQRTVEPEPRAIAPQGSPSAERILELLAEIAQLDAEIKAATREVARFRAAGVQSAAEVQLRAKRQTAQAKLQIAEIAWASTGQALRNSLRTAETTLKAAEAKHEGFSQLRDAGAIPFYEMEQVRTELELARAQYEAQDDRLKAWMQTDEILRQHREALQPSPPAADDSPAAEAPEALDAPDPESAPEPDAQEAQDEPEDEKESAEAEEASGSDDEEREG